MPRGGKPSGTGSKYTAERAALITSRLAMGEPLAMICRDPALGVGQVTVRDWMNARPEFAVAVARAREDGYDAIAADCLEIADFSGKDTKYIKKGDNEYEVPDHEWIQRSKLRVDTRLKLLACWDPKRYAARAAAGGEDDNAGGTQVVVKGGLPDE